MDKGSVFRGESKSSGRSLIDPVWFSVQVRFGRKWFTGEENLRVEGFVWRDREGWTGIPPG